MRLATTALLALLLAACGPRNDAAVDVQTLHESFLIIDTHVDIGEGYATEALDPGGFTAAQVDLPKMRAGGVDGAFFIVYTPQGDLTDEGFANARAVAEEKFQAISRMVRGYSDEIGLATSADEVEEIAASGRLVALIGMENAYPLGPTLDDLPMWRDRGVAYVSLTHFGHNQFGGSANALDGMSPGDDAPLTPLGRELVTALNDLGIMVDVSHVGRASMMEMVALSRAPVIASHSSAAAVYPDHRNLDDEQLRALRNNGGVAQMVAYRRFIRAQSPEQIAETETLRETFGVHSSADFASLTPEERAAYIGGYRAIRARYPDVTVAEFVDHIDHAVEIAGIDHVGIASDFDGGGGVLGWDNAAETISITEELLARGYSEDDMAKLWGGNVLRVMRAVEAAATR